MRRSKRSGSGSPPEPGTTEIRMWPLPGFGIRGADIESVGVVWASLGGGHLESFDRRECTGPLTGPAATGDHCPEGWNLRQFPGTGFAGLPGNSVESTHYARIDQWDTLGPGRNGPNATGDLFDGVSRAGLRPLRDTPGAVSDELPRQGAGRPHRRPERRPEGRRALVHGWRPGAPAAGGWQGHEAACSAHRDATRSPGPLIPRQPLLPG